MPDYCANRNADKKGHHEVHVLDGTCVRLPDPANRDPLGAHATCAPAVSAAKRLGYATADGCYYCSTDCHTG